MQSASLHDTEPIDLASLPNHLDRIAMPLQIDRDRKESEASFLRQIAEITRRTMRADEVAVFRCEPGEQAALIASVLSPDSVQERGFDPKRLPRLAESAAHSRRAEIDSCSFGHVIATATSEILGGRFVIVSVLDLGQAAIEPFVLTQQLVASSIATWQARCEKSLATREDWISDLESALDLDLSLSAFATHVVDEVAINMRSVQVAICIKRGKSLCRMQVAAVGGNGRPVDDSLWIAASTETLIRSVETCCPSSDNDRAATTAHQKLLSAVDTAAGVSSIPLLDKYGEAFGALMIVHASASDRPGSIAPIGDAVSRMWVEWQRAHQTAFSRLIESTLRSIRARWAAALAALLVAAFAMIPVPYRVTSVASIVPQTRNFVVAPYNGRLRAASARIGDQVAVGETIAELDDRELRIDLASLLAERDRATKERDIQRASGDVSGEQLAEYELARVNEQIKLTQYRLDNLVVVSPIDGIVIGGELEDVNGAPVETGQLIAEIARLDRLWIEIHVPEVEMSEVRAGMAVRAAFDATGGSVLEARVDSIFPSAEVRGGENVFVARAAVANQGNILRPGISGTAKIRAADRPLIAVLFRQLWRSVRRIWI